MIKTIPIKKPILLKNLKIYHKTTTKEFEMYEEYKEIQNDLNYEITKPEEIYEAE